MFYKIVTEPYYEGIGLYSQPSGIQMRWSGDIKTIEEAHAMPAYT